MAVYVALLRAINVGGHQPVAMADLRDLLTQVGFGDVRSLLQTGNLVFRGATRAAARLEALLETEAGKRLRLQTDFFVRTGQDWNAVLARNPFRTEAKQDPARLVVVFLKDQPDAEGVNALRDAITGPEVVRVVGKHAYIVYPNGIGRSRLTLPLIERKLGSRGTGRNWNTVLKLAALAKG